ncbi:sacsin N-terminal ATP-binding-like domain-containing protein [uncultured Chryseobacterium sp.]|uniref:sacsin N-terminal ATP-binding-like domain-containing protein n=1 Tax=uncultured Chryseobacterium sp. TaxID=259322 RepID=UPI00374A4501
MSFKDEITTIIKSNLKTYLNNSDRFIADYNRELELTKEYNGRQLLELLQNADDAGSHEVLIIWDRSNSKLTISNKGEPFESAGIKSLMLANLSTKTKISYIGNKGLGFRSILNWAEKIDIKTNGCVISFSEKIAENVFNTKLKLSDEDKKLLRLERNLSPQTIPFPVLAIPNIKENKNLTDWTTSVEITYRQEFESDIENQLLEIREEILLFLNNIHKIKIQKDAKSLELKSSKQKIENYEQIIIQDKQWKVFSKENVLPEEHQDKSKNEKQFYNLKVAIKEDLSDDYNKLFNFFPTQLTISLPCIIHGTFELNSSRNHLNESKRNEFILKELVLLMKDCALYLTKQNIDWRPLKLISSSSKTSDSKLIETFYKNLENLKNTESIYPCINNQYNKLDEAVYYSDEFNGFFKDNFPEVLPELIIPIDKKIADTFEDETYERSYLVKEIDKLAAKKLNLELRAELIKQLAKVISKDDKELFSLLVNESDKLISKDDLAFTPVMRSGEEFKIPKSVKVDFMHPELYDLLISKLENEIDKKEQNSRELQRIIKSVVNLQPYDSN